MTAKLPLVSEVIDTLQDMERKVQAADILITACSEIETAHGYGSICMLAKNTRSKLRLLYRDSALAHHDFQFLCRQLSNVVLERLTKI